MVDVVRRQLGNLNVPWMRLLLIARHHGGWVVESANRHLSDSSRVTTPVKSTRCVF